MVSAIFISSTTFKIPGDATPFCKKNQRVTCYMGSYGNVEVTVVSAVYSEGDLSTLVTIIGGILKAGLYKVKLAPSYYDDEADSGNIAEHPHSGRSSGGYIPAAQLTQAQIDALLAIPVPVGGDGYKIVRIKVTEDGFEFATLTPVTNQTTITEGSGTVTIGTAQNIGTASSPEFAGIKLSGLTGILEGKGSTAVGVITASGALKVLRRNAANNGYEFVDFSLNDVYNVNIDGEADGDLLRRNGGIWERIPKGTNNQVLAMVSNLPQWADLASLTTTTTTTTTTSTTTTTTSTTTTTT